MPLDNKVLSAIGGILAEERAKSEQELKGLRRVVAATLEDIEDLKGAKDALKAEFQADADKRQLEAFKTFTEKTAILDQAIARANELQDGREGPQGPAGEQGDAGPAGPEGPQGEKGDPGLILRPIEGREGQEVGEDSLVSFGGGLWLSNRLAKGTPDEDPGAYTCLTSGYKSAAVVSVEDDPRAFALELTETDGTVSKMFFDVPTVIFKGRYSAEESYVAGDLVTHSHGLWHCRSATSEEPGSTDAWSLASKFPKGRRGERGERGLAGPPGAPADEIEEIIQGKDAGEILVCMKSGRVYEVPVIKADPEDDNYPPLTRYRGVWAPGAYSRGDVVKGGVSIYIAKRSHDNRTAMMNPDDWELFIKAPGGGGGGGGGSGGGGNMTWRSHWASGQYYNPNDMVIDGDWVAVCKNGTFDRPAPVSINDPDGLYDGASPQDSATGNIMILGQRYTGEVGRVFNITGYRVYTNSGQRYTVYSVVNPDTAEEVTTELTDTIATTTGWQTFNLPSEQFLTGGQTFDLVAVTTVVDPAPTTFSGNWDYDTPGAGAPSDPVPGQIQQHDSLVGILKVHKTDNDAGDRSADLATVNQGDSITIGSQTWLVTSVNDAGAFMEFGVSPATQTGPDGVQNVDFTVEAPALMPFVSDPGIYAGPPQVQGLYALDGLYDDIVPDDNQYSCDIVIGEVSVSSDWELLPRGGGTTGGSGLPDAPSDGNLYARQDAAWVSFDPSGLVSSVHGRTGDVVGADSDYTASNIDYLNATSGLTSTHVQGAIDEIEDRVDTLEGGPRSDVVLINEGHDEAVGQIQVAYVAVLPGTPDANTLYFIPEA